MDPTKLNEFGLVRFVLTSYFVAKRIFDYFFNLDIKIFINRLHVI